jgi:transcriptional regulator with XRE-family HTH domain
VRTGISNVERGAHSVSVDRLFDLADALDVPITALFGPSPPPAAGGPQ